MAKDDRTEKPTPKRLGEARRKGQVARSVELPAGLGLALAIFVLPMTLPRLSATLQTDWITATLNAADTSPTEALAVFGRFFRNAMNAVAPAIAVVGGGGVIAHLVMAGAKPNPHQLKPKWERINPKVGVKRLVGTQALYELGRNAAKLTLLGVVAYGAYQAGMRRLLAESGTLDGALAAIGGSIWALLLRVAALALVIGVVDAIYSKRKHLRSLRMTKNEVKDEHKQAEGNPQVKGEIRKRQMKMSRSRMIAEVATATAVVTNPTHFAVALRYEPGAAAPVVVAKGTDELARKIRLEARKWGVPVRENRPLARTLYRRCQIGDQIPVELYQAVAELLAAIFRTRRPAA